MSLTRERVEELREVLVCFYQPESEAYAEVNALCDMALRAERAEAERDGWKERAESSEHNFGVLHDELAAMRAAPAAPEEDK